MKPPFGPDATRAGKLRQEIFALGDRHRGEPLAGARRELTDPDLTPERRALLRAVVAHLAGGGTGGEGATPRPYLTKIAYFGVIAAAVAWTVAVVHSLVS